MNKLKELMVYILKNYPHKDDLSNARLTKLIYLSDWHQCINYKKQISPINWYFDNFGPYVSDVQNIALEDSHLFTIEETYNMFGKLKRVVRLLDVNYEPRLDAQEFESVNHIINNTAKLNWDEFIKLVYSTYPIISSDKYSELNLVKKAAKYRLSKVNT